MTTEATFPPFTTDGLFAEEAALFDAIVSIVMALVVMIAVSYTHLTLPTIYSV